VAIALAAGQAALCAVIGWLTFGPVPERLEAGRVDRVAAPPAVIPTPTFGTPAAPVPALPSASATSSIGAATDTTRPERQVAPDKTTRPPATTTSRPVAPPSSPSDKTPMGLPVAPDPPTPEPSQGLEGTPTPTPTDLIVVGAPCDVAGELGVTLDDIAVKCTLGDEGLQWQLA
jgi:hypothetical protein